VTSADDAPIPPDDRRTEPMIATPFPPSLTRRQLLAAGAGLLAATALPRFARAAAPALVAARRTLDVNGRPATVFGIAGPGGRDGAVLEPGERFVFDLVNDLGEETIIHWHGQTPPYTEDGVADPGIPPIAAGERRPYDYAPRAGTHWMHSHHGLQEQRLLAAPLIVRTAEDARADVQEVVLLLEDFTFRDPAEVLAGLVAGGGHGGHGAAADAPAGGGAMKMPMTVTDPHAAHGAMPPDPHAGHGMAMGGMSGDGPSGMPAGMVMDLNDVNYDAYLANRRTLADPEVMRVERGGRVRLRIINASAATAYWVDLGGAEATLIAVDGTPVRPVAGTRFPLSMAQRIDLLVDVPAGAVVPVLAQREGDVVRTGLVLAAPGATVAKIGDAAEKAPPLDLDLERRLVPVTPLPARPVDRTVRVDLAGGMTPYAWSLNGAFWPKPNLIRVKTGERVLLDIVNDTMMAHPMHLHGHAFQVVEIDGTALAGAVRDTVLLAPRARVKVVFDADNPGRWPFHCHNLYHMATGMMTDVLYDGIG
jgi:FtsP/CotA-like multicopper oxidase with cupredoxin domain